MAARRKPSTSPRAAAAPPDTPASDRELVILTTEGAGLRAASGVIASATGTNVGPLERVLTQYSAVLAPMFGPEERVRAVASAGRGMPEHVPDLARFYRVDASDDRLDALQKALLNEKIVESAYIKPRMYAPTVRAMAPPQRQEAPPATPSFVNHQGYLERAPGGIDARFAWTRPGGRGQGVRIIDVEGGWQFSHEDMLQNQGGAIGGTQRADWRNHGTAVIGTFGADDNTFGVTGICPDANIRAISIFGTGQSSSKAITDAANALSAGDIILIELHAPGPRHNFQDRQDQLGYIGVEFWPADFAAIVFATSVRGVIVIEAAGNGAENLDDPLYDARPANFPATWRNPFNLANPQSGAILAGAGAPPPGTHGRNHGPDRSRLGFSNFGARVDVQGWGEEVTTTGYGDLQGGSNEDLWYTDTFNGTSSASPVVVGAIGCMQGGLRGRGRTLLTPATARDLLRQTGSPQQDAPGRPATQRIGNRPDLEQMFQRMGIGKGVLKDVKDKEKREKEVIKETKDDKEKELKEIKDKEKREKEVIKEVKDKETKEIKDKEKREKDFKEKEKEVKDKGEKDKDHKELELAQARSTDERIAQLEETVAMLAHFIGASDRPDLQHSALGEEADLGRQLQQQATDAKALKDDKDLEKGRES